MADGARMPDAAAHSVGELLHELQVQQIELQMQNETLRHTQTALEESRDSYADLYDFSPVGYLTLSREGLIVRANLTCASLLGVERSLLTNQPVTRFFAPEDSDRWQRSFLSLLQQLDRSQTGEFKLRRIDGAGFVGHLNCLHHVSANGEHTVRITLTDISGQKSMESRLRESEDKLRAIFEGARDGILLADAVSKTFTSCNPALCRMLGYSAEEISRLRVQDLHPVQQLPNILEEFERHASGDTQLAQDIPFKRRDDSVFYADITSAAVHVSDKVYLVGIIRDITERRQAEETLRLTALKYQLLFDSSRDALMILSPPSWRFSGANKATLELFGVAGVAEFCAFAPWEISPEFQPDERRSREKAMEVIERALREGSHYFEWLHQRLDGRQFISDVLLTRMELGDEVFLQATVRDITERKRLARALAEAQVLAESEEKFRKISESAHDAIIMMGSDKCISFWNTGAERMFGYSKEEVIGREMHPLLALPESCRSFEMGFESFRKTGTGPVIGKLLELTARRKSGAAFPVEVTISPLQIDGRWHAIGIFRDITDHKLYEEKIRKLAFYDALTGLPNRRLLKDRLDQAMVAGKRSERYGALMFVDLDNFKPLNDRHGHSVGDLLLIEVARRITSCLREIDTVARFGGDEFVVLLSELDHNKSESTRQAAVVAEKIRAILGNPYFLSSCAGDPSSAMLEHHCSASIGVTLFNHHEIGADDILKRADVAMYQAKENGRNRLSFFNAEQ